VAAGINAPVAQQALQQQESVGKAQPPCERNYRFGFAGRRFASPSSSSTATNRRDIGGPPMLHDSL
jgi:hypothetical protein